MTSRKKTESELKQVRKEFNDLKSDATHTLMHALHTGELEYDDNADEDDELVCGTCEEGKCQHVKKSA